MIHLALWVASALFLILIGWLIIVWVFPLLLLGLCYLIIALFWPFKMLGKLIDKIDNHFHKKDPTKDEIYSQKIVQENLGRIYFDD